MSVTAAGIVYSHKKWAKKWGTLVFRRDRKTATEGAEVTC